jgi:hypothetical protein
MTSILTLAFLFVMLCATFYISFSLISKLLHPLKQRSLQSPEEDRVNRLVDDITQAGSCAEYHQSAVVVSCETGVNSVCPGTVESASHLAEGVGSLLERVGGVFGHLSHWH